MIALMESALADQPAGVVTIRFADGRALTYDRKQLLSELAYWQQQARAQAGSGLQMCRLGLKGDA
jgi:hypothetical protein